MPNILAYLVLLAWPIAIVWLFRKMPPERAFIWAILGGYMLLPEATAINLPMIPAFDKYSLPNLTALVVCVMMLKMRFSLLPEGMPGKVLTGLLILAPVASVFANNDALHFGSIDLGRLKIVVEDVAPLQGMRIYDSISALVRSLFLILPFFMARKLLASEAALTEVLRALVVAGLIYSVPMLYEIRFSPQLHTNLYGFFQHDFGQMIREGGFRPIVFMPHGLWVAFFATTCALSALYFVRQAVPQERLQKVMIAVFLVVMVWLCKSMGPRLLLLGLAPLVLFFSVKMQLRVAAAMAAVAMSYPLLRGAGVVPTGALVDYLYERLPERAQSLEFRFDNEDLLLARAWEKPLVGWGGWGRNLIRDPMTGEIVTISDGMWVIVIGQYGWLGYLGTFGLLCLPLFLLWWRYRKTAAPQIPPQVGVCALLLGANLVDLLPNATLVPLTWLLAGALLGHAEVQRARNLEARFRALQTPSRKGLLLGARLRLGPQGHSGDSGL